jgi:hypothetical protein
MLSLLIVEVEIVQHEKFQVHPKIEVTPILQHFLGKRDEKTQFDSFVKNSKMENDPRKKAALPELSEDESSIGQILTKIQLIVLLKKKERFD